jgi:glycosyltransferase involved in cell wall biosynthesis
MTAYNEENFIRKSIESVLNQSVKFDRFVICDDASTDDTAKIIQSYPRVEYIKTVSDKFHISSYNMVQGLTSAYDEIRDDDFKYLFKIDADCVLTDPRYIEKLIHIMEKNSGERLGIVAGVSNSVVIGNVHRALDGAKLFLKECFDDIGGLDYIIHWDTHAMLKAYKRGWLVRTVKSLKFYELRDHKRERMYEWFLTGFTRSLQGFTLYHTMGVLAFKGRCLGGLVMFFTYLIYQLQGKHKSDFAKEWCEMDLKLMIGKKLGYR